MWYSLTFFDPDDDMMAVFFGNASRGALPYVDSDGSVSGAFRLMSPADLCDALDEILLSSDDADIVIQRLAPVPGVSHHSIPLHGRD
jgi:hypothetical protein